MLHQLKVLRNICSCIKEKKEESLSSSTSHVCFHFSFLSCFSQQCVGFFPKLGKQQFKLIQPWWIIHPSGSQLLSVCFHTWLQEKPSSIRQYFWGCSWVLITFPAYQQKNESNIVQFINFTNIGADLQLMKVDVSDGFTPAGDEASFIDFSKHFQISDIAVQFD